MKGSTALLTIMVSMDGTTLPQARQWSNRISAAVTRVAQPQRRPRWTPEEIDTIRSAPTSSAAVKAYQHHYGPWRVPGAIADKWRSLQKSAKEDPRPHRLVVPPEAPGWQRRPIPRWPAMRKGTNVKIRSGPFTGRIGVVAGTPDLDRRIVVLEGTTCTIIVAAGDLEECRAPR